jgi:hypothetical protein
MPGFKKWNTNDVLTAGDLNGYVGSQVVYQFASTAARDAAITGADLVDGMLCYVKSGDSSEGLYAYNGTNWTKGAGWNAPWGIRSVKTDTSDRVRTTTLAELATGLRTTVTFTDNRYLKFTLIASLSEASAGGGFIAEVWNTTGTATKVARIASCNETLDNNYQVGASWVGTSAAGAVYTIYMQGITHSVNVLGSTVQATKFIVEDIGPSGAPL